MDFEWFCHGIVWELVVFHMVFLHVSLAVFYDGSNGWAGWSWDCFAAGFCMGGGLRFHHGEEVWQIGGDGGFDTIA